VVGAAALNIRSPTISSDHGSPKTSNPKWIGQSTVAACAALALLAHGSKLPTNLLKTSSRWSAGHNRT